MGRISRLAAKRGLTALVVAVASGVGAVEPGGSDYGKLYFLTDRFERHRDAFENITERLK